MRVFAGRPTIAHPYIGVYERTPSLFQQCSVGLGWFMRLKADSHTTAVLWRVAARIC